MESQSPFRAGDGAHTAADAFSGIGHDAVRIIIYGQGIEETPLHACPADHAIVAGFGQKIGGPDSGRVVPSRPASDVGAAATTTHTHDPVGATHGIVGRGDQSQSHHLVDVSDGLCFGHPFSQSSLRETRCGATDEDAVCHRKPSLAFPYIQFLRSRTAGTGHQGQILGLQFSDKRMCFFSRYRFRFRMNGMLHGNRSQRRGALFGGSVVFIELLLNEEFLMRGGRLAPPRGITKNNHA